MRNDVRHYIRNCHTCQHSRTSRHVPDGVLRLLAVPDQPWQHISTHFVTGLPSAQGYDTICIIVDRFTKQRHLIPCTTTINGEGFAELFIKEVFRLHRLSQTVTSDRGPQFIAAFWKCLCMRLNMQRRLSSPDQPQTDGQPGHLNVVMELYRRCYVNNLQDDWPKCLPLAEFAANNQMSESTKISPFFANAGWDPRITTNLHPPARGDRDDARADWLVSRMAEIHELSRTSMIDAQQRFQNQADK